MIQSLDIIQVLTALQEFRSKVGTLKKSADNPFFKAKYLPLPDLLEAIEKPLQECGLTYTQLPTGECLTTIITHLPSGEFIGSEYNLHVAKKDPQAAGASITYARRYTLATILGLIIDTDDDGNAASGITYKGKFPEIFMIDDLQKLREHWENNPTLHSDKNFKNEIAKRKMELGG